MHAPDAVAKHLHPDPELLALQVAVALVAFNDELGHSDGWNQGIHGLIDALPQA